jgi:hypothetical protein
MKKKVHTSLRPYMKEWDELEGIWREKFEIYNKKQDIKSKKEFLKALDDLYKFVKTLPITKN